MEKNLEEKLLYIYTYIYIHTYIIIYILYIYIYMYPEYSLEGLMLKLKL